MMEMAQNQIDMDVRNPQRLEQKVVWVFRVLPFGLCIVGFGNSIGLLKFLNFWTAQTKRFWDEGFVARILGGRMEKSEILQSKSSSGIKGPKFFSIDITEDFKSISLF
ncbi:hypothetical protein TNIN_43031 [Trichonephila inaurata madagascariensis]|uniref:Transmembrane protein n=1 Tax=Trichonephila inaurata madagascariensis TaxID=2747483 RepID=A0A8X7CP49_9ARAC|nr:hypothetical protein TNIN_43031 [Trichonephila inaurata madagascariensis]